MERDRTMDASGCSAKPHKLIRRVAACVLLIPIPMAFGQELAPAPQAQQLCARENWGEAIQILETIRDRPADLQLCYGIALAQVNRLDASAEELRAGQKQHPQDKRFPIEMAGVFFKEKQYSDSRRELHRALKLDASDSYANDFLGTIYFLEHNLGAALKYWNRAGKPVLAGVSGNPVPRLNPALLDRAFAFAPASVLRLGDLEATDLRLRALDVFPSYRFDLQARPDTKFDLVLHNWEKNGVGSNKWIALLLLLRGLPAQSVYPEYFNIRRQALNFKSFYRWDKEKRRVDAFLEGPFLRNPKQHFQLGVDLRNENWDLRNSSTGSAPLLGALNLRRQAISGSLAFLQGARWSWTTSAELSHRDFRSVVAGQALDPSLLLRGYALKEQTGVQVRLWELPEKRLTFDASANAQLGHIWSAPEHTFEKLQASALLLWSVQPVSDDYQLQQRIWAGKTFGDIPFDELSVLGIGGDNDLWLRGHIATRDGRKGSAPLGRNYFLSNSEIDKHVFQLPFLNIKAGPFIDTGKVFDALATPESGKWLVDAGADVKVSAFGFGMNVSYGRDFRLGNNAFYVTLLR